MRFEKICPIIAIAILCFIGKASCQTGNVDERVNTLLAKMTLDEKIGQLNQYNGDWEATGPVSKDVGDKIQEVKDGRVGAVLNIMGTVHVKTFQDAAMRSRLKIPLLFGQDVIHGAKYHHGEKRVEPHVGVAHSRFSKVDDSSHGSK